MKKMSRSKNAALNIFFTLLAQGATIVSGLVVPRLVIAKFGSDVNGLMASIIQFLSYISLLEAGIGGVMSASLYKPLDRGDFKKVSSVISAAKSFYHKIAAIFLFYIVALCFIYPLISKSNFDVPYTVFMIIILSISTLLEYYFAVPYTALLRADQKVRIVYIITTITILLNVLTSFALIMVGASIHIVKLVSALVFALKPVYYSYYVRKNYALDYKASGKGELKQKWNGLVHHIAYFVQTSIDVMLITLFMDIKYVSVYAVYYTITSGIQSIVLSVANGSAAGMGNLVAREDKVALNKVLDTFEFVQSGIASVMYTITAVMIVPFVSLYTKGVTDINYIAPAFAYVLISAHIVYCIRYIYSTVTLNANRYKETQKGAIAECLSNLLISLALIKPFGILGVAIGTLLSAVIRCFFDLFYLKKHLVYRPISKFFRMFFINALVVAVSFTACNLFIDYNINSWHMWVLKAIPTATITVVSAFLIYFVFNRDNLRELSVRVKKLVG